MKYAHVMDTVSYAVTNRLASKNTRVSRRLDTRHALKQTTRWQSQITAVHSSAPDHNIKTNEKVLLVALCVAQHDLINDSVKLNAAAIVVNSGALIELPFPCMGKR